MHVCRSAQFVHERRKGKEKKMTTMMMMMMMKESRRARGAPGPTLKAQAIARRCRRMRGGDLCDQVQLSQAVELGPPQDTTWLLEQSIWPTTYCYYVHYQIGTMSNRYTKVLNIYSAFFFFVRIARSDPVSIIVMWNGNL